LLTQRTATPWWAERYERPWAELFGLLDELVARIAATIFGQVETAGIAEARRKPPEHMTAYDCLLRGLEYHRLGGVTKDNPKHAVEWFERAIESDPNYGLPYAWWVCSAALLPGFDVDKGLRYTKKALELDPNNAEAHRIMGSYQMWLRNFETAEHHICRAMTLNPSNAYIRARCAAFYTFNHRPERALELIEEAEQLDPFLPVWCLEEKALRSLTLAELERHSLHSTACHFRPSAPAATSLPARPRLLRRTVRETRLPRQSAFFRT
jgi:tetratricopeptide (TPR) repeat protein